MSAPTGRLLAVASALLALAAAAPAAGQGLSIATPDSSIRMTFGGRVQTIFNTTSVDDEPVARTELRRVRLEANLYFGRFVQGKIQPEYAGSRVALRDAYVRFNFDPGLQLWAGQAHRPFGIITPISSARMLPIERGVHIRGVANADSYDQYNLISFLNYSERDVGLQLRGEPRNAPLGLSYAVGFFNGPAATTAPHEETWQGVARVAVHPVPNVRVGAGWSRLDHVRTADDETLRTREGQAWEADVELGSDRGGLHVIGEVSTGDFDPFAGAEFLGAQGWVGYRTARVSSAISAVEPLLRVSYGDPDVDDEAEIDGTGGTLITPGVNLWLGGLNRIALNWDVWNPQADGETVHSAKVLFQLAF
ncbi:porin [Longimicrobium sp.]|uniref:porin n=1 Tax=Longimicrobium sp. TaxID=2029185 RepID=UPI002E329DC1|nr:porin [Longimicrobium sp.]HEX6042373.1 porin [Longimicrobium sp.]